MRYSLHLQGKDNNHFQQWTFKLSNFENSIVAYGQLALMIISSTLARHLAIAPSEATGAQYKSMRERAYWGQWRSEPMLSLWQV